MHRMPSARAASTSADGGHADGVRAELLEHAHLGGGLIVGAEEPSVDAFLELDAAIAGDVAREGAEGGIVGVGHVGKAGLSFRTAPMSGLWN